MALFDRFERLLDQVIPPPEGVVRAVRRGESLLAAGDRERALRIAEEALPEAPAYLRAIALRVDALAALGRPFDGLSALDEAAKVRPLSVELLARAVELSATLGDALRALEVEAQVRARLQGAHREVAERLTHAAELLLDRGDTAQGLRVARSATLADPSLGLPWLLLGRDAVARRDALSARNALDRALRHADLGLPRGHRIIATIAAFLGDHESTTRALRRAWILGDEDALGALLGHLAERGETSAFQRVLADAGGAVGELARALVALQASPDDPSAHVVLASVKGAQIPPGIYAWALRVAVDLDLDLAATWARATPERDGARAVLALHDAERLAREARYLELHDALPLALEDPRTRSRAEALHARVFGERWRADFPALLEDVTAFVGEGPARAALKALRRGLDGPLRVAILGEFSAGKSTFVNALVGDVVSPMGVLPTTATAHWLRHGARGARVITDHGPIVESQVEEAPRVAARLRAEGQRIDHVEVTLELPRLARLELVDTPGFNAGNDDHEAAVRRAFALADIALWIFDARQAGRLSELGPLQEARDAGVFVLGILNKVDAVSESDLGALLAHVRAHLGTLAPCVLGVSARAALAANGDDPRWRALEHWVDSALVGQREAWRRYRAAREARTILLEALTHLEGEAANAMQVRAERQAIVEAIAALRERLPGVWTSTSHAVEVALQAQLASLQSSLLDERAALLSDAIAEATWRARERSRADLSDALAQLEQRAERAGLLAGTSVDLVAAPLLTWIEAAASEGVRDALQPSGASLLKGASKALTVRPTVVGDPLLALERAVERAHELRPEGHEPRTRSLTLACEVLAAIEPPPYQPNDESTPPPAP